MTPRVWFRSISLENVRSFGTKQTINLTDVDGNAARWNVILGDNGTGKTTVLNSILMSEYFRDHPKLKRFLRSTTLPITISTQKEVLLDDERRSLFSSKSVLKWDENSNSVVSNPKKHINLNKNQIIVVAYPATRVISEGKLGKDYNSYDVFINGYEEIVNPEEWLIEADYLSLKNSEYKERFNLVKNILLKLFHNQVSDIFIRVDDGSPKVFFQTYYGNVRLHELSLGYKTLVGWTVDFAKSLLDTYPDSIDPLSEPAICLVDEIDLHLHPKFQRDIVKFLTKTFRNTQFIVTAHSPLIVVASEEYPLYTNIILLKREGDQTIVVNDALDVSKWSVDQILNSDLFGHVSDRSELLNQLRRKRDKLLSKRKLTKEDATQLAELDEKIGFVPFGKNQEEIKAENIIQQLADVLRKQQQA